MGPGKENSYEQTTHVSCCSSAGTGHGHDAGRVPATGPAAQPVTLALPHPLAIAIAEAISFAITITLAESDPAGIQVAG